MSGPPSAEAMLDVPPLSPVSRHRLVGIRLSDLGHDPGHAAKVGFRIDLGHCGRAMPENLTSRLDTVTLANPGSQIVTKLIGMPMGDPGLLASAHDGLPVSIL